MKKISIAVIILVLISISQAFASGPPGVTKAYVDTQAAITTEASLSGLSSTAMTGYPEGAQPLSDNLNYLTVGDDPFLTLANRQLTAPTPIKGHKYVASPWWDPATRCLTLTSNTTFTASHTIVVTETALTFAVNEIIKTDDATNPGPFTVTAATNNGTTTTLTVSETVSAVSVASKTVIHGFLYWVGYTGTVYFTWMDDQGNLILSDINMAGGTIELPNGTADVALATAGQIHLNTADEQLSFHSAADGEISGEVALSLIQHKTWSFDPKAVCDGAVDRLFLMTIGDDAPEGIIIDEWKVSFEADPTTEADLDLKYADAFIGVGNAAVIDVLDTTTGAATKDTDANINSGAAIANGKVMYLEFGTAYTETTHQVIFEIWYHAEED
jgi:hypothetical protein